MIAPNSLPVHLAPAKPGLLRRIPAFVGDTGLLLVVIFALPVAILIIGLPIALLARLGIAMVLGW